MRRLLMIAVIAGAIGGFANPQPADAETTKFLKCIRKSVASCNEDFPPENEYMVSIRGWCYMIRTGLCLAFD